MEKATDEVTLKAICKIGKIIRIRERYAARCNSTRMVQAGLVPADWFKHRLANLDLEKKVFARLEKSWFDTKKQLRSYEKENGLDPVILDGYSRWFGYR